MYSKEPLVASESPYFFYSPSQTARSLFFYPTIIGRFRYLPGYLQKRNKFDSFQIILVEEGAMEVYGKEKKIAEKGNVILLDCYAPHEYGTLHGCTTIWMHFDGVMARPYYEMLTAQTGNILIPHSFHAIHYAMQNLLRDFATSQVAAEPLLSLQITSILHWLFPNTTSEPDSPQNNVRKTVNHIHDHFSEDISLEKLAGLADLSPYYFSRIFKKETGQTPHQFLISTRISSAKYYLSTTQMTISEIAFAVGFKDESSFCLTFRKREGQTPKEYRIRTAPKD